MIRNFMRQSRPCIKNLEGNMKNSYKSYDDLIITKENIKQVLKPREHILEEIVKNYNERWNKNVTIEEYLKEFTRKHRGSC